MAAALASVLLAACAASGGRDARGRDPVAPPGQPAAGRSSATPAVNRHGHRRTDPGRVLAGRVVGVDPGHNGRNASAPAYLARQVWNGRASEDCDTAGAATDAGYPEPRFTFAVATYLAADLRRDGARVVLTRRSNSGLGPCVTTRAAILNRAHPDVAVDIHADGGPPGGRGFAVLEPLPDGPNDSIIAASRQLGGQVVTWFSRVTGMPTSTYDGRGGVASRGDLAGLNLATEPKVLIECGNMRNAVDARLLTSPAFQRRAAAALRDAVVAFLHSG